LKLQFGQALSLGLLTWGLNINDNTLDRESKDLCWAAVLLAVDSTMSLRVKERFLIIFLFTFTPNWGSMALPKEVNPES